MSPYVRASARWCRFVSDSRRKGGGAWLSLIKNYPFVDGNKRTAHAIMETFLVLNDYEIDASVVEQEQVILDLAAGIEDRESFTHWLTGHVVER